MKKLCNKKLLFGILVWMIGHMGYCWAPSLVLAAGDDTNVPRQERIHDATSVKENEDIIEKLAEILNADVYLIDPLEPEEIDIEIDYTNIPAEEALKRLLKGHSYAIIYHADTHPHEIRVMGDNFMRGANTDSAEMTSEDPSPDDSTDDSTPHDASAPPDAEEQRKQQMLGRIGILQKQMDSGYADAWYDHWSTIKDPKYMTHPKDQLEEYQKRLAQLSEE